MRRSLVAGLILLAGCAAGGPPEPVSTPTTLNIQSGVGDFSITTARDEGAAVGTVPAPVEKVWAVLPAVFESLGLPAGVVSEGTRTFGNPNVRARGKLAGERAGVFLECGNNPIGAPRAGSDMLEVGVVAALQPEGEGSTQVRVRVQALATGSAGATRTLCSSTGKLEARLLAAIALQASAGS